MRSMYFVPVLRPLLPRCMQESRKLKSDNLFDLVRPSNTVMTSGDHGSTAWQRAELVLIHLMCLQLTMSPSERRLKARG